MAWSTQPGNGRGERRESRGFDRDEMERRTQARDVDRRHDWDEQRSWRPPEGTYGREEGRGYGEGSPGPYFRGGEQQGWGDFTYGDSGGYGQGERGSSGPGGGRHGGSYGGTFGGSWGGMGAGAAGTYGPSGRRPMTGEGRPMGRGGERPGFRMEEPDEEARAGAFGLHTAMTYGQGAGRRSRGWEREGALVRDVMTRDARTLPPDATVGDAARLMREEDTGIIPVVSDGRVAGVLTDRDIAVRVVAENRNPFETRVSEVMSEDVHVCTPDDRLTDAVHTMAEEQVRRLPVVDRDDRLRGMLSMTDVAREAEMDYALQEALEQIARRRSFWSRW